jgi:sterol 3beta-glucosyltransferase
MRIAILASGTRGDVQPMLAIADVLGRRGHSVVMTVNRNLAPWARRTGVEVVECEPDYERFLKSTEGQQMLRAHDARRLSKAFGDLDRAANDAIGAACVEAARGADLIASTVLTCYRGDVIAEKTGTRHGVLATFPVFPTGEFAYLLLPMRDLRLGFLNRASYGMIFRIWWKQQEPNIQAMRAMLGLPPVREQPDLSGVPSALLVSEALVPRPRDWPAHITITGNVLLPPALRERLGEATPPDGIEAWLDAGDAPVFFGFGSMPVADPAAMLRQIAEVTKRRGLRALVGAGWSGYAREGGVAPHVFVAPTFDHDRVLPRCRAAVHHGGAGTTMAVARAGLPALVASVWGDQPFWGWRLVRSGVGATIPFRKMTMAKIDRALDVLLEAETAARAKALGAVLAAEDGATRAADTVESWAP